MMLFILWTFYVAMVVAGYLVEIVFAVLHLTPTERDATVLEPEHQLELHDVPRHRLPAARRGPASWRFFRTGRSRDAGMMNGSPPDPRRSRHHGCPCEHHHH